MLGWGTTVVGLGSLVSAFGPIRRTPAGRFWLCWLASYTAYKLAMPTSPEVRHFLCAMPAFAGLAACLFDPQARTWVARGVGPILLTLGLGLNLAQVIALPPGLVGYEAVAACLAAQSQPGNVLLTCPHDQDLIFRYRGAAPGSRRRMIRGDRTLAIRLPEYAKTPPQILAREGEDVLEIIRRGRTRYVVTSAPLSNSHKQWTEEMALTHRTITSQPGAFELIGQFPIRIDFEHRGERYKISVWRYRKDLPPGPSDLAVVIPTARMVLPAPQ